MNVVLLTLLLLAIGCAIVRLVVQGSRASRNLNGLEPSHDAALEKSEGDPAGTDRRDARQHPEARVIAFPLDPIETSLYELAEFGGPILFEQQRRR